MAWMQTEIEDLDLLVRGRSMIGATASIQGLCFTQRLTDDIKVLLPSRLKPKKASGTDRTRRTQANKERTGQAHHRTGRYVRTNEVRRRVHAWIDQRGGSTRVKFWTITFPEGISDQIAYKALNIFLTRWRKATPEIDYLWTVERQQNGTAHFHLVTDLYMNVKVLNHYMRTTLTNMGDLVPWSYVGQASNYNGITIAPPVFSRLGVENYLVKYLTKAIGSGFRQPWHCSRNIGTIRTRAQVDRSLAFECIADEIRRESGRHHKVRFMVEDQFIYIPFQSCVNRRIANMLLEENRRSWVKSCHHTSSRSRARPVAPPTTPQLPTVQTTVGEQLTLLYVPVSQWTSKRDDRTKSRCKVFSWAPVSVVCN